eukprot:UN13957
MSPTRPTGWVWLSRSVSNGSESDDPDGSLGEAISVILTLFSICCVMCYWVC